MGCSASEPTRPGGSSQRDLPLCSKSWPRRGFVRIARVLGRGLPEFQQSGERGRIGADREFVEQLPDPGQVLGSDVVGLVLQVNNTVLSASGASYERLQL
jgi:hypothetical protein